MSSRTCPQMASEGPTSSSTRRNSRTIIRGTNPDFSTLAFMVPTRSTVRSVHERVIELGSEVLHPPSEFPQYPPPYFATFWLDPFGFMLEAVCHYDRD